MLLVPILPHCRQTCLCPSSLPSCIFPSKVSDSSSVPHSVLAAYEAAASVENWEGRGDFRGFIIFFKSILSWVHKTVLSPPAKSLLINIHACSVLSWFLCLHTYMCKSRYTKSTSNTHSFLSPYVCFFILLPKCSWWWLCVNIYVQHIYEYIHTKQHNCPVVPCFLVSSMTKMISSPFFMIKPWYSTEMDIVSPSSFPAWLDQVDDSSVMQFGYSWASVLFLKDNTYRTPNFKWNLYYSRVATQVSSEDINTNELSEKNPLTITLY